MTFRAEQTRCETAERGPSGAPGALVPLPENHRSPSVTQAFTLVELLLVMTLLIISISIAAPTLASFFRGRTLHSEARRLLALTHHGQGRAVSEGIPMILWVDAAEKNYGLEQESGWDDRDTKAVELNLDKDLKVEVTRANPNKITTVGPGRKLESSLEDKTRQLLPSIRFLPDGTIDESSLVSLRLSDRDGTSLWLTQTTNRLYYEIRSQSE